MFNLKNHAIALIVLALAATTTAYTAGAKSDKAQIEELYAQWKRSFIAHDLKGVESVYAPGKGVFAFDVVPPREFRDRNSYMKNYAELFKAFPGPITCKIEELDITVVGSAGYAHCITDMVVTGSDGSKVRLVDRTTDVFRKIKGKWLIVLEHNSIPVDLETGKPDMLSKP